jgi:hypothetical protein
MMNIPNIVKSRKSHMRLLSILIIQKKSEYVQAFLYAVNVGTHNKNSESKNSVNRGYLVVLKGRKIG